MTLETLNGYEQRTLRQIERCRLCGIKRPRYDCGTCGRINALRDDEILDVIKELQKYMTAKATA